MSNNYGLLVFFSHKKTKGITMKLGDYIIRRLLLLIPVLIGITFVTFILSHMIGDPAAAWLTEKTANQPLLEKQIRTTTSSR